MTDCPKTQTVIRAGVVALPWIGGVVGEILFGHRDRAKAAKVGAFLEELKVRLHDIDEEKIDFAYLETEDFADLLEAVLGRAKHARKEEQRTRLCRALCEQIISPRPLDFAELFLDLALELHESQIQILKEHSNTSSTRANAAFRTARHYRLNHGQYRYFIQILISRGLMLELHGRWTGIDKKYRPFERLEITELGREFLKFLTHDEKEVSH
jgi:hypothetical protein